MARVAFHVDNTTFRDLSVKAGDEARVKFFAERQLSGQERLLYQLSASPALKTCIFLVDQLLFEPNEVPDRGLLVVTGEVVVRSAEDEFFLGPGSVLGLAEAICQLPLPHEYRAHKALNCKDLPADLFLSHTERLSGGIKSLVRLTTGRILGSSAVTPPWMAG
ncbi:MAG: hypothetical protein EBT03_02970 [Betaproteobacteria bacterium]|nr:hypothetical protein [Betaproteobacteria bacterium]NBT75570.1 hypothetical protein [Betaproteobacteria bacterium]NBY14612.1 hypothetical protein [Betaproteobacteria bacterium]NCA15455.1 hypothetical protein [Betaproteobacteria bacterium]